MPGKHNRPKCGSPSARCPERPSQSAPNCKFDADSVDHSPRNDQVHSHCTRTVLPLSITIITISDLPQHHRLHQTSPSLPNSKLQALHDQGAGSTSSVPSSR
ncbi:hypothetical protein M758_8G109400 [Ceratodon purpureus]|nr:hypothetical protein M758_8G109400 [Ceratodon purpureus]